MKFERQSGFSNMNELKTESLSLLRDQSNISVEHKTAVKHIENNIESYSAP